ncbi:MAG: ATP-dependent DNA helicase [Thermoplasmataceae archaeon]
MRDYQQFLSDFILESLKTSKSVAIEAPTGSGKTIVGLFSALKYAKGNGKKIVYLTRTNSQQEQVVKEIRHLRQELGFKAVAFQGRHNLCPLYHEIGESGEIGAEALSRFCNSRKKQVRLGNHEACHYFNEKIREKGTEDYIFANVPMAEEFLSYAVDRDFCPYESLKLAASSADLVVMPYAFFINPSVAERFLARWGVTREDLVIVMDEAHNLPEIARESSSFSITMSLIESAEKEAQKYGDPELFDRFRMSDYCEMVRNALLDLDRNLLQSRESALILYRDFEEQILISLKIGSDRFKAMTEGQALLGDMICDMKEKEGSVPRSFNLNLASRIRMWSDFADERFVAILSRDKGVSIEVFCIEPTDILEPLRRSATIHMSGTLEPIEVYRNLTGFGDLRFHRLKSVFPRENRLIIYSDSFSTKFDELDDQAIERIAGEIRKMVRALGMRSIIFFTSYSVMDRILEFTKDLEPFVEKKGMAQADLMAMIGRFRGGTRPIYAVMGGRISEGMNFPGDELRLIIIVGVPYPKPDARQKALYSYFDHHYHNGWEYSVTFPVVTKLRQTIGRLLRSETDTGVVAILDRRAGYFRKYIPDLKLSRDLVADSLEFFRNVNQRTSSATFAHPVEKRNV